MTIVLTSILSPCQTWGRDHYANIQTLNRESRQIFSLFVILGYDLKAHAALGATANTQPSCSIAQVQGRHINERLKRKVDNA